MKHVVAIVCLFATLIYGKPLLAENPTKIQVTANNQKRTGQEKRRSGNPPLGKPEEPATKKLNCSSADDNKSVDCQNLQINKAIADANTRVAFWTTVLVAVSSFQFVGLILAVLPAIRAANAAKKSADVSEQALTLAERAFLQLVDIRLVQPEVGKPLKFELDAKNWGRTPCKITRGNFDWILAKDAPPYDPSAAVDDFYMPVMPDETVTQLFSKNRPLKQSELDSFANGEMDIHVWGTRHYTDMFGQEHVLGFGIRVAVVGPRDEAGHVNYRSFRLVDSGYNYDS